MTGSRGGAVWRTSGWLARRARATRRRCRLTTAAILVLSLLTAGCSEEEQPTISVGGLTFPESAYLALGAPERHALADQLAFGLAVASDRVDELAAPLAARATLLSALDNLPHHLAASDRGYDDAALRMAYERDPEWEMDVRHVVRVVEPGAPGAVRDSALAVVSRVAGAALAGDDFAALAATYSEEPGADRRGGLLDPGRRGTWVESFWNAALALEPGETSGVVESEYGYHVLRLDARRPVPFEEADRGALLRRLVSPADAARAAERWRAEREAVVLDGAAVTLAIEALLGGTAVPADLVLAGGRDGAGFLGADLVAAWAALPAEDRRVLEADPQAVRDWIDSEAVSVLAAREALAIGAPTDPLAGTEAARTWRGKAAYWVEVFGYAVGMPEQRIRDAATAAVLSGGQDVRAARNELRSHRPILREMYPVEE